MDIYDTITHLRALMTECDSTDLGEWAWRSLAALVNRLRAQAAKEDALA